MSALWPLSFLSVATNVAEIALFVQVTTQVTEQNNRGTAHVPCLCLSATTMRHCILMQQAVQGSQNHTSIDTKQ